MIFEATDIGAGTMDPPGKLDAVVEIYQDNFASQKVKLNVTNNTCCKVGIIYI